MFTLTTDTSCDIPRKQLDEAGIPWLPLTFTIDGVTYPDDFEGDRQYSDFYAKIRAGAMPTTSQINAFLHEEFFDKLLDQGIKEIVHLPLSSGLSNTYLSALQGAQAAMQKHPGSTVTVIDTLSATQGHRLLLTDAQQLRDAGVSAKEATRELIYQRARIHHWIIADDLMHLKRGGRVSGPAAYIGTMLNIKPIIIINDTGKLVVVHKAKGTAKAMGYVLDRMKQYGEDIDSQTVYLASADAPDKAAQMEQVIKHDFSCKVVTGWIGPVIGAHTGPGTLGIVFKTTGRLSNS